MFSYGKVRERKRKVENKKRETEKAVKSPECLQSQEHKGVKINPDRNIREREKLIEKRPTRKSNGERKRES